MPAVFEVSITIHLYIKSEDQNYAENTALDLIENHLADMLDCPVVVSTSYTLSAGNPKSKLAMELYT